MPSNVTAYQIAVLWFDQRDLNEGQTDIEALAALIERERLLAGAMPGDNQRHPPICRICEDRGILYDADRIGTERYCTCNIGVRKRGTWQPPEDL